MVQWVQDDAGRWRAERSHGARRAVEVVFSLAGLAALAAVVVFFALIVWGVAEATAGPRLGFGRARAAIVHYAHLDAPAVHVMRCGRLSSRAITCLVREAGVAPDGQDFPDWTATLRLAAVRHGSRVLVYMAGWTDDHPYTERA